MLIDLHAWYARTHAHLSSSTQPLCLPLIFFYPPRRTALASTENYSIHLENVPQLLRKMPQMQFNPNGFDTPLLRHYHIHANGITIRMVFSIQHVRFNARSVRPNFKNLEKFSWILLKRNRRNDGANWKQCYVDTRLDQHAFARTHTSCRSLYVICMPMHVRMYAASVRHFTNTITTTSTAAASFLHALWKTTTNNNNNNNSISSSNHVKLCWSSKCIVKS